MRVTYGNLMIAGLLLMITACGGGSSSAKIRFARKSSTESLRLFRIADAMDIALQVDATKPVFTSFKMKLVAAYLAEDVDPTTQDNIGKTEMIYLNPECENDISECGLPGSGLKHLVQNYFDFSDPELANAALNAQSLSVAAGTYKYVRIEFCKYSVSENISYQIENGAEKTASLNTCGITSAEAETPMVLAAGKSVTINLAYDLQDFLYPSSTDYGNGLCDDSAGISPTADSANPGSTFWCISHIAMTPSATIE